MSVPLSKIPTYPGSHLSRVYSIRHIRGNLKAISFLLNFNSNRSYKHLKRISKTSWPPPPPRRKCKPTNHTTPYMWYKNNIFVSDFNIFFCNSENTLKISRIENKSRKIAPSKINKPWPIIFANGITWNFLRIKISLAKLYNSHRKKKYQFLSEMEFVVSCFVWRYRI